MTPLKMCNQARLMHLLQGTRNPFVALFQRKQVPGTTTVTASISRSTRGMRSMLQNPPDYLNFEMPLAPVGSSIGCSERHTRELQELGQVYFIVPSSNRLH